MEYSKSLVFSPRNKELVELRAALARHQRIFQGSHGYGYFDWDLNSRRMNWSGGYWRYLGYSDADIDYISNTANYFDYIHPDDYERVKEGTTRLLKNPGPGEVVYRTRRKKGGYVWTEIRADTVRDESGWVNYLSGIAFDVTKQKQTEQALMISEARHARIIQSSNDGMWEWAAERGGFYFSNRCWEHLGYSGQDEVVREGIDSIQAWRERMHPNDGPEFDRALEAHVNGGAPFDIEYRIKGKDGSYRWIRGRGQMTFNEQGDPLRMSGTNMDVTQLKIAEGRALKAKEQAEQANKAKSDFLSSMSHELRTPLNAILGFAQLIEMDTKQSVEQKEHAVEIRKAGQHLLELVGDVLDLAQIEAGRLNLCCDDLSPLAIIKDCIKLLQNQADIRGISVVLRLENLSHDYVHADSMRLKQVFLNLLGNAIKYNREGGKVIISCELFDEKWLRILIEDTGKGIPKARQSEVFEPFNRLGAERGNIEGSGVGLVVTKQLVDHMGGSIDFSCEESVGSKFWVDLPVVKESSVDSGRSVKVTSRESDGTKLNLRFVETKRILYVEDNKSNQRLLSHLMKQFSQIELLIADDALKGIFQARLLKPDVILMDINLPKLSGYEALDVLMRDASTQSIPVIALSANAMDRDIQKGKKAGFYEYLTKPLNLQQLVDTLNELLAG